MPDVPSFADLQPRFETIVRKVVWCSMTTVDRRGRPRARIIHPIWDGSTGYLMTGRHSFKAKHLAGSPYVSLSYVDAGGLSPVADQAYAECKTEWLDDPADKQRVWDLFKAEPEPYGYDPAMFFPAGPADAEFGVLRMTPWRLEIFSLATLQSGGSVWRNDV